MRIQTGILLIVITLLLTGCEYEYSAGLDYKPQVVVNSILNPDSTIKVNLFWTKEVGSKEDYKRVEDFSAKIYENDNLIFEGNSLKDSIITTYKPKAGKGYRLEVNVPEYGIVSAETSIPLPPTVDLKYIIESSSRYSHYFEINKISANTEVRSIIVRAMGLFENHEPKMSSYIYANNAFCDQFNMYIDQFSGNGSYFDYFIRIPSKNLGMAMPMSILIEDSFTIYSDRIIIGYDDWGFPIYDDTTYEPKYVALEVIAPSQEYDKYYKSAYLQWVMGDTGIPVFNIIVPILTNVENGLGIFAGYSYFSYKVEMKQDEK